LRWLLRGSASGRGSVGGEGLRIGPGGAENYLSGAAGVDDHGESENGSGNGHGGGGDGNVGCALGERRIHCAASRDCADLVNVVFARILRLWPGCRRGEAA
jgi:hypothetical protein